ncbi:MAG: dihydropyrimidinase [Bacillota bacterium]
MKRLLLKNGKVVAEMGVVQTDLMIEGDTIINLGPCDAALENCEVLDCSGKYILPGVIDAHVHFYMPVGPGIYTIDDFYSGSVAAACGGVTTVIDYVEPMDDQMPLDAVRERRAEAEGSIAIDFSLHYVVRQWDSKYLQQLDQIVNDGLTSFKVFTTYEGMMLPYEAIHELLKWCKDRGVLVTFHAEDDEIVTRATQKLLASGVVYPSFHADSRPAISEAEAVRKIINLAKSAGAPIYFVHVSSYEGAKVIQEARKDGLNVFAETCPHYLYLNSGIYKDSSDPQLYIMCPPLRDEGERASMWKAVTEGVFSVIATDHCAFSLEQKLQAKTFNETLAGIPGVETLLPLMYQAVNTGEIDIVQLTHFLSKNPAEIFGLYPRKGVIREGSDADLVVFDPEKEVVLKGSELHSKAGYTPFEGSKLKGYPQATILRGKIIYQDGVFIGEKGFGKFIPGQKFKV